MVCFGVIKKTMKALAEQRTKNMRVIQEKMQLNEKEMKRFNPVSLDIILDLCYKIMILILC